MQSALDNVFSDPASIGLLSTELEVRRVAGDDGSSKQISDEEVVALIAAQPDVEGYVMRIDFPAWIDGERVRGFGVEGQLERIPYPLIRGGRCVGAAKPYSASASRGAST